MRYPSLSIGSVRTIAPLSEGEGSVPLRSSEGKQALDIGSFQYSRGNEKGLASLQGLDCVSFFGSPTWARTRDLRINSRWFGSSCRPRQCSLSGVRTSNTFESFASISTGLEPRTTTGYWKAFRLECRVVRLCCFWISAWPPSSCLRSHRGDLRRLRSRQSSSGVVARR